MPKAESRPWWQDGILGRVADREAPGSHLAETIRTSSSEPDGLALDGLILDPARLVGEPAALDVADDVGLRILVDLAPATGQSLEELVSTARTWLDRGVAGVAIDVGSPRGQKSENVTQIFPTTDARNAGDDTPLQILRQTVDEYANRILVGRRLLDAPARPPKGPHLVMEGILARQPWRGASIGDAIESVEARLPAGAWPGYAMGAPRRSPFALGLPDDALACSAALLFTLRGTPCIDLGEETGLPDDPFRRRWYRRLATLRRREVALRRGGWRRIAQPAAVLGYLREHEAERLAVLLNPGRRAREAHLPTGFTWTTVLQSETEGGRRIPGGPLRLVGNGVLIARAGAPQSRALGSRGRRRATGR